MAAPVGAPARPGATRGSLAGVAGSAGHHQLSDPLNKVVYSIHHPQGARNAGNWDTQFGYLAGRGIPVVVGEWTNWAHANPECWDNAGTRVPEFLGYVRSLGACGALSTAAAPNWARRRRTIFAVN